MDREAGGQPETMMRTETANSAIEIRLRELGQLFNTFEASPFHEGIIAPEAEEYLLQRVKDLPKNQPVRIVLHLPAAEAAQHSPADIAAALASHFADRATAESKGIHELFRNGRRAALIGFVTLSICLFLAWHITNTMPARPITRILQESFVILGWVSMWKPIEMFLYDWLPPSRRQRLLERLAAAEVIVRS
jgi:hypothetical protein